MSNVPTLDDSLEGKKLFLERAKLFREHIQTVLSLATGSLVLSVTFLHDIAPHADNKESLRLCWVLLVWTIILGVAYNYLLSIYSKNEGKWTGRLLVTVSFVFHGLFIAALYYLTCFGLSNL